MRRLVRAVALSVATGFASLALAGTHPLVGVARDTVGRVLDGVDVYVLPDRGGTPVGLAQSDAQGRFVLADLPPGIYKVAGIKAGYLAFLGRVNTSLRGTIDLLLRPLPRPAEPGSESVTDDRSWSLRLPARGILRDTDDGPAFAAASTTAPRAALLDLVDGRLEQMFRFATPSAGSVGTDRGLQGSETRVRLASAFGERANLRVLGRRESADAARVAGVGRSADAAAADVLVDVSYDPTVDSRVSVRSFYSAAAQTLVDAARPRDPDLRRAERSWGCDAKWSLQIDPASRLDVRLDYQDASLRVPDVASDRASLNRSVGAEGRYESIAARGHRVQLAFQAGRLDLPDSRLRRSATGDEIEPFGPAGWHVGLRVEDAWSLTGRASLVYGLAVRGAAMGGEQAPVIVPRLGASFSDERLKARAVLAYFAGAGGDGTEPAVVADLGDAARLGYEAEAQIALPFDLAIRGSVASAPALRGAPPREAGNDDRGARPVFFTDGAAAASEATLGLERATAKGTAYVRWMEGRAAGSIAVASAFREPVTILADERLVYHAARLGWRVASSGTDLAAEIRRVEEDRSGTDPAIDRRSIELSLVQDLARVLPIGTPWSFVLVGRAEHASSRMTEIADRSGDALPSGREIRAGFAVAF